MCQYCGCQDIPAIKLLTTEHDNALNHVRDAEIAARAQNADTARSAAAALADVLATHLAVEEQGLFPALADAFPEHVQVLEGEHKQIEHTLAEMSIAGQPAPGWDIRLLQTMDLLREHILKEQDGLFPAALANLDADDWDRLDTVRERVAAGRRPTGTPPEPARTDCR